MVRSMMLPCVGEGPFRGFFFGAEFHCLLGSGRRTTSAAPEIGPGVDRQALSDCCQMLILT